MIATQHGLAAGSAEVQGVTFTLHGPHGSTASLPGDVCAQASHPEQSPPYLSTCWAAVFTIPPATPPGSYTLTAISPLIPAERSSPAFQVAASPATSLGR